MRHPIKPENESSQHALGGAGIRFHGGRAHEAQDAIQILSAKRTLHAAITTLLTTNYKAKQQVIAQAKKLGYANHFEAIRADIPWRPVHIESDSSHHNVRPTTHGSQTAIVVGTDGEASPVGANEIYCDRLGKVRIRFNWKF